MDGNPEQRGVFGRPANILNRAIVATYHPPLADKIGADCPNCGFSQLESVNARSTFCRQCGQHGRAVEHVKEDKTDGEGVGLVVLHAGLFLAASIAASSNPKTTCGRRIRRRTPS